MGKRPLLKNPARYFFHSYIVRLKTFDIFKSTKLWFFEMEVNWNLAWLASDRDNYILHYLLSVGKLIFSSLSECGDDFYQPKLKQ